MTTYNYLYLPISTYIYLWRAIGSAHSERTNERSEGHPLANGAFGDDDNHSERANERSEGLTLANGAFGEEG